MSEMFVQANSGEERRVYLAAGEALLSAYYGTSFHTSYVLGYVAYILFGIAMLQSEVFGRTAAQLAIATSVCGFGFYLPSVGALFSVLVVLLVGAWHVIGGIKLYQYVR